jgi:quinol monooxygenase YgiN
VFVTFTAAPRVEAKKGQAMSTINEATFIPISATKGHEAAVADLLTGAAPIVRSTEPLTLQWMALRDPTGGFAVVDFFQDNKGREAHFAGKVAAALKGAAGVAVVGGWDKGVVARAQNARVLSATVTSSRARPPKVAVRIDVKAKPGKEAAMAAFLTGGAEIVKATEPGTLLWYAIETGPSSFAIFDLFPDDPAKAAHFGGKVAAALKAKADELVAGGWDAGVVANIKEYEVLSATY